MSVMRRAPIALLLTIACGGETPTTTLLSPPRAPHDGGVTPSDAGPSVRDGGAPRDGGEAPTNAGFDDWLSERPEVTVERIITTDPTQKLYVLRFSQPEDHGNLRSNRIPQRLVLRFRGADRPMVLHTTGYHLFGEPELWIERSAEPADLFLANELIVEHRFFGESIAEPPDWTKLNIYQSAADSHEITRVFRDFFRQRWVATGVSKGGMTAYFHHHHFPEDLDGVIPYVAPISFGEDLRYQAFLDQIGAPDGVCRRRVLDVASAMIVRRAEIAQYLRANDPAFASVSPRVLEAAIVYDAFGFEWGFWQYWASPQACAALPDPNGVVDAFVGWVEIDVDSLTNPQLSPTVPYRYQVANELGSPDYARPELYRLARDVDFSILPTGPGPPWTEWPAFDPEPMERVDAWLRREARDIVGFYGAWDPWTGGMPTVSADNASVLWLVPEVGHGAQWELLGGAHRVLALDALVDLMQVPPVRNVAGTNRTVDRHQALVETVRDFELH